jgi:hypothetical protein
MRIRFDALRFQPLAISWSSRSPKISDIQTQHGIASSPSGTREYHRLHRDSSHSPVGDRSQRIRSAHSARRCGPQPGNAGSNQAACFLPELGAFDRVAVVRATPLPKFLSILGASICGHLRELCGQLELSRPRPTRDKRASPLVCVAIPASELPCKQSDPDLFFLIRLARCVVHPAAAGPSECLPGCRVGDDT